jgi:hypothetical protein
MQANYNMWQARRTFKAKVKPIHAQAAENSGAP